MHILKLVKLYILNICSLLCIHLYLSKATEQNEEKIPSTGLVPCAEKEQSKVSLGSSRDGYLGRFAMQGLP